MTIEELYNHFGQTDVNVCRELKIGSTTLQTWRRKGFIPIGYQMKIEERTDGLFKAKIEDAKQQ